MPATNETFDVDQEQSVQAIADEVYNACSLHPRTKFTQQQLAEMFPCLDGSCLFSAVNHLLQRGLFKAYTSGGNPFFEVVKRSDAEKLISMNGDEKMIYELIAAAGSEGIWIKHLKMRTNLHDTIMRRCLKSLENGRYIKDVRSVKAPAKKLYMLRELQPSSEVTGGPWFTDSELDTEFVHHLLTISYKFIHSKSYPKPPAVLYEADHTAYPTASDVHSFLSHSQVTQVELDLSDVQDLLQVLIYDGRIERRNDDTFRAGQHAKGDPQDPFTEAPCGTCPVFHLCNESGPISASTCEYFDIWLNGNLDPQDGKPAVEVAIA